MGASAVRSGDARATRSSTVRFRWVPGVALWRATEGVVARTPSDRDRVVDLLRIGSLVVVVLGHLLMVVVRWRGDTVRIANLLAEVPELKIATWVFQVMPIFFAAGAIANRRSYDSSRARGEVWREWLWHRVRRLVRPTTWYLAIWIPLVWLLSLALPGAASTLAKLSTQLLWFLGVYLLVVATTRWQIRLARFGYPIVAVLLAAIALVDLARFHLAFGAGLVNFVLVWFMTATLGLVVRDHVGRGRHVFVAGAFGALALNAVLVATFPYPISMVGMPGERISNMSPPTIVLALHAVALMSLVGLAWPSLSRLCARVVLWRVVAATGAATMTIYLWHLTAVVGIVAVEHGVGFTRGAVDDVSFWLTTPLHVSAILCVVIVLVSGAVPLEHRPLPWLERSGTRPGSSAWWTVLSVLGVIAAGCGFLVLAATGMGGFPFARVTTYAGLPLTPGLGFLLLALGVLAVRGAGRRVGVADPADRNTRAVKTLSVRARPDVNAIVHLHSHHVTVLCSTHVPSACTGELSRSRDRAYRIAMGFTGQPVPPGMRSGATTHRNSHRPCATHSGTSRVRSTLSTRCSPMPTMPIWWTGNGQSATPRPGVMSEMPSPMSSATSRSCNHGRHCGCRPAMPSRNGSSRPCCAALRGVAPAAHDQEVAAAHRRPLRRLGCLEVGDGDRGVALEVVDAPGAGDVEEHAAPDQAVGGGHHGVRRARRCSSPGRPTGRCTSGRGRTCGRARRGG